MRLGWLAVSVGAASGCASDARRGEPAGADDICTVLQAPTLGAIHYASRDALIANAGRAGIGDALCAQDDPDCARGAVYLSRDADGDGEHSVVVATQGGFEGYPGLFASGSPRCCDWAPSASLRGSPSWLVVRQSGAAGRCEARACRPDGVLTQFAVFERASGRLAFTVRCPHSEKAQLIVSGAQFVLSDCAGQDRTFAGRELLACFRL